MVRTVQTIISSGNICSTLIRTGHTKTSSFIWGSLSDLYMANQTFCFVYHELVIYGSFSTKRENLSLQKDIKICHYISFVLFLYPSLTSKFLSYALAVRDMQHNRFYSQLKCTMFENSVNCVTDQSAPCFHIPCISTLVAVQNSKMGHVPNPGTIFTMFILANVCCDNYVYLPLPCIIFKNMVQFWSFRRSHNWLHNKPYKINQELYYILL